LAVAFEVPLLHASFVFVLSVAYLICSPRLRGDQSIPRGILIAAVLHAGAVLLSVAFAHDLRAGAMWGAAGVATAVPFVALVRSFTLAGRLVIAGHLQLCAIGMAWTIAYIVALQVSLPTRVLMLAGLPLMLATLPLGQILEQLEVVCRLTWRRPRRPLPVAPRVRYPKVSLHVAICSEPPDVVVETLDALSRLDYPNFDVLVIDNNTKERRLWEPVQRWCLRDARFRFFHLESCPGAKAGALNFALRQTAPDATLISLVDSDYQTRPDFLAALVGFFDDPQIGFVQTPHDYRGWQHSLYQRMCYWEYRVFFSTMMVSWNERNAAITVGTMCVIRREALRRAGGWSEWCLTEDSELAPRIHALGYSSVFVQETFGRGLIPETFCGYAKQRRRWTYGPTQELKRHLPMFLPRRVAAPSALVFAQKVHHLRHDLGPLLQGVGFLLMPLGLAVIGSMLLHGEQPALPGVVWAAAIMNGVASQALGWCVQRRAMRCSFVDVLGASFASHALAYSTASASLRALVGLPMTWQRTNKFKTQLEGVRRAIRSARVELMLALALIAVGAAGLVQQPRGLLLLLFLGLSLQGVGYLAAPILALIGEWDLARGADREAAADLPFEQKNKSVFTDLCPWVEGSESPPSLETIGSDAPWPTSV
jgi:cellulose synthase/poly-beta-1,6-N-acetylglucosamine synthase-like glycosyltransferase